MAHDFGVIENDRHRIETELRGPVRYDIRAELFLYLKLLGVGAFRLLSRPVLFTFAMSTSFSSGINEINKKADFLYTILKLSNQIIIL